MSLQKANISSVKELIATLPHKPGVYQYFDKNQTIIYVGKAKDLKKRVSSYFVKDHQSSKTAILVRKITDIKHIIVDTEEDALLLENNLIKKYQPRYNVLLKDDKSYPWICIKNERFPRVYYTRKHVKDGSQYYGPYTSVPMVKAMLDFFKQVYKLRTCKLNLSEENVGKGKYKVCLEYHIGNCKAPCIGEQDEIEYSQTVGEIKNILKGNIHDVLKHLDSSMKELAAELRFEEAQEVKEKLELIDKYRSKSTVVNPAINNVDVFSILVDMDTAYVNFLKVANGAIIQVHTLEMKSRIDETEEELLATAITEIRQRFSSLSREIIVPFPIEFELNNASFHVPQRGDKKKLLELSERNLKYFKLEKMKQLQRVDPERHTNRILETMQKDLQLKLQPKHIECFDNSNIQGAHPVSACVVFKDAKPSKKDYRHFNVKTVEGPDDFATMEEAMTRRYTRLLNENEPLPQLVIVDGGKGQLGAAVKIFRELGLLDKIALIGIAKKLEEIFFPGDPIPLYLDRNSETLKIIQQLRNEAHRFGITHHRNRRSKAFITSELHAIAGIGDKTSDSLLKHFKTIDAIKKANPEELANLIGKAKALIVYSYFHADGKVNSASD